MDAILFGIFASLAVICALVMVTQKHPIASALSLVGVMGSLAILYMLLGAEFIAAAQIIVYAGAIMVLFLFVIMLLNAGRETRPMRQSLIAPLLGLPLLIVLLGGIAFLIQKTVPIEQQVKFGTLTPAKGSNAYDVGKALFTTYLLPFEVTSVLVLIAILGAVVLARKEME